MSNVAPEVAEAIAAAGLTAGVVSGGAVVVGGIIVVGGLFLLSKLGETIGEIQKTASKRKQYTVCCCNKIGPSGQYMCHNIRCKSRKEAEEKARHFHNANGTVLHNGHYHATRDGKKISGYHFCF